MIKNYLKIAIRNLRRHPGYMLINVAGFTVGIACCLLIVLYVLSELRYDRYHEHTDQIYRVVEIRNTPERGERHVAYTAGPVGPAMVRDLPEVQRAARLFAGWRLTITEGESALILRDYYLADPELFQLFDYTVLHGDPVAALSRPNGVVLTRSMANQLFGTEDVAGRVLDIEAEDLPEFAEGVFEVMAVIEDPPDNTHLDFKMLLSLSTVYRFDFMEEAVDSWHNGFLVTFVMLEEGVSGSELTDRLRQLSSTYRGEDTWDERSIYLQPLADIHFFSSHIQSEENKAEGNLTYVYILGLIAFIILLIACFNYMNMITARSARRAREVGLRKMSGAQYAQLVRQFLTESILTVSIGMMGALLLLWSILPSFNALIGKDLSLSVLAEPAMILAIVGLTLLVGLLAGTYPAFYLSSFEPAHVLKKMQTMGRSRLRQALVVTQFTLSIGMIAGALIIDDQLGFLRGKQLGFDQSQLVVFDINHDGLQSNFKTLKAELLRDASIQDVTVSSRVPGDWKSFRSIELQKEGASETELQAAYFNAVDPDFFETYGIQFTAGRNFDDSFAADSTSLILNETAARLMFAESPVGEVLRVPDPEFTGRVVGVVEDFHFHSLHDRIEPLIMGLIPNGGRHVIHGIDYFTLKIGSDNTERAIDHMKDVHARFDPVNPIEYAFLNEWILSQYRQDERVGRIFNIASFLTILIALVGLVGLAGYMTEQRTKEIGVRKVLGANVFGLVWLLSTDFLKMVGGAFLIAVPITYVVLQRWLDGFAYHVELSLDVFLMAGLLSAVAALLTVGGLAIKASLANPVHSLRVE